MKVIFTDNVPGVASRGDIKTVKSGFFRNYLQPYKKASPATDVLLAVWEEKRKKMLIEKEQLKAHLEEIKRRVAGGKVTIEKKITKKGTLYGAVKPTEVSSAIKTHLNLEVPAAKIAIPVVIKALGTFEVDINFGEGVSTKLPIEIVEKKA